LQFYIFYIRYATLDITIDHIITNVLNNLNIYLRFNNR